MCYIVFTFYYFNLREEIEKMKKSNIFLSLLLSFSVINTGLLAVAEEVSDLANLSLEELLDIEVVSATKKSQKLSEAPAIISVITSQQIKQRGYRNVAEAINSMPGLDVLEDHLQYNLGVRGINGGQRAWSRIVKVMIDNQPVSFRSSTENWLGEELIPINVIERIEVIRGPSSALYGANAFLGVINIITKNSDSIDGGEISASSGSVQNNLSYGGNALVGKKIGDVDFVVSGNYSSTDRSGLTIGNLPNNKQYTSDIKNKNDIQRPASGFSKINYSNETLGKLSLDSNYQLLDSFAEFQDWGVLTHNNRVNLQNFYVRGKYFKDFSENFSTNLSLGYAQGNPTTNEKLGINQKGLGDWITRDLGYSGIDVTLDTVYSFKEVNSLTAGFDFTSDSQKIQTFYRNFNDKAKEIVGSVSPDKNFTNTGVFLQGIAYPFKLLSLDTLDKLSLTAGLRYDIHNIYGNVLNYRLAGNYPITDKIYTKLLYGTSFKAPAAVQLYSGLMFPGSVTGNPNLTPETAKTLEFAIGGELTDNLNLSVNGFYSNVFDKVELIKDPTGKTSNVVADNVSEISSYGVESELYHNWKNLSNYINFSYQKSSLIQEDPIKGKLFLDTRLYPTYMVKFGSNYRIPDWFLNLNLEGKYISSRIASDNNIRNNDPANLKEYSLNPYFLLDFTLSTDNLKILSNNETRLSLKVSNLLDQKYFFPGFKDYDIPALDRSFMLKLTQQF
jgi:outer membrane receptor for ferrienterochelin and colicins